MLGLIVKAFIGSAARKFGDNVAAHVGNAVGIKLARKLMPDYATQVDEIEPEPDEPDDEEPGQEPDPKPGTNLPSNWTPAVAHGD